MSRRIQLWLQLIAACGLATGCSHHTNVSSNQPSAPVLADSGVVGDNVPEQTHPRPPIERAKPSKYVEVGMASWYGPGFNHRKSADGQVFDQNSLTAAHRTLPLGSMVRVTNLNNGTSLKLKITDRGPFVPDRMLDLSVGAAKALGIWPHGTAQVRVELISSPPAKVAGGKWCVQIGAFSDAGKARELKASLQRRYSDSEVLEFGGPSGDHWVRIRPPEGNRRIANQIAENLRPKQGNAYLVRLD